LLGDAEIRVVGKDGTWLIAPTLVLHYVTEHAYRPPAEFIDAVSRGRSPLLERRIVGTSLAWASAVVARLVPWAVRGR
jgi:hypothetical protein